MEEGAIAGVALVLILAYTGLVVMATRVAAKSLRRSRDKGKTFLLGLNSNNKAAQPQLVKAPSEGYQVPGGPFVKFEGNYTYIDRENVRPVVVYNADTGFAIKGNAKPDEQLLADARFIALCQDYPAATFQASTGEASEMDGMIYSASLASNDVEQIQKSHGGIPWVQLAVIAGFFIIGLVGVIGFVLSKVMAAQGG